MKWSGRGTRTAARPRTAARGQAPREQLQLGELDGLVHLLKDRVDVRARVDELGREPERLRRRVRVLEPARVGDEANVERLGDRRRQRDSELVEQVTDHLGGGRGVRVDQVDVSKAAVVVMVVDVDYELRPFEHLGHGPSRLAFAQSSAKAPLPASGGVRCRREEAVLARERPSRPGT
jgi:hypothetical protein